ARQFNRKDMRLVAYPPLRGVQSLNKGSGAACVTRTRDPIITNSTEANLSNPDGAWLLAPIRCR
ncbi:hypothetical protein, partial [Halomonas sp. ND22Bw]|uniref:hypothetical protein n=1 Tax=Halomonas sp. ND22Bw TaxID=2054178 RepID=UPI001C637562